jgi:Ca2+/H+ antiporter
MRSWARLLRPSVNWLLVFIPASLIAELTHQPLLTFITAALAIVPLAGLIGRATDQLAICVGPRLGGLLNATFGNLTELIVAVLLIGAGDFEIVKASLIGSIVGNLLLVLGVSLFVGGLDRSEQAFSARAAGVHTGSLVLAVAGLGGAGAPRSDVAEPICRRPRGRIRRGGGDADRPLRGRARLHAVHQRASLSHTGV